MRIWDFEILQQFQLGDFAFRISNFAFPFILSASGPRK